MFSTFASFIGSGFDAVFIQPTMISSEVVRHTHVHRLPSISFIRPFIEIAPRVLDQADETGQ